MKVGIRLVLLRFDIMEPPEKQQFCPVGVFFRQEGASKSSNVFISHASKAPGLPVILAFPELVFPSQAANDGPLDKIEVAPHYRNEYRLGAVTAIEVPDGAPEPDKHLFVTLIASHERFAKVYVHRYMMERYFVESGTNRVIDV
jgi:hypothetical protein